MTLTPTRTPTILSLLRGFALCLALALALRAEEAKLRYDLSAGDAVTTFREFSDVSGKEILFSADAVRGVQTSAIHGNYTAIDALNLMVAGTPLMVVRVEKTSALGVRRRVAAGDDPAPGGAPARPATPVETSPAARSPAADRTVLLDPFEVQTSADTSYGALNSNSITRFNTELDKMPVSADIMTQAFMDDIDMTSLDSMIMAYGGGTGMAFGNPAGQNQVTQPGDRANTQGFTSRGVSSGTIRMNGFLTEPSNFATTTNFDIERVELIHGPQGLLYGPTGAGGVNIATTDQARFSQTKGSLQERIDQYGSNRQVLKYNVGGDSVAATFDVMNEGVNQRRLFFGANNTGYYTQLAFRLPLNTTLRLDYAYTRQQLNGGGGGIPSPNFGGTAVDPRSGEPLAVLLYTNQLGAINPATGKNYDAAGLSIDNGHVNWLDIYSYPGAVSNWEIATNYNFDATADTVWTPWLSTNLGFNYNRINDQLGAGAGNMLYAPGVSPNPYPNDWAMSYTPGMSVNNRRHKNFRVDALLTNSVLGVGKSQTSLGWDFQRLGAGGTTDSYYQSDANGNLILSPTLTTNLQRQSMPAQYWTVDGGPVFQPPVMTARGASVIFSPQDNKYYVKQSADPRVPSLVTAANPLGLANYAAGTGITGLPEENYEKEVTSAGFFMVNYTSWWNDLVDTMVGYRLTNTANHIPNTTAGVPYGVYDTSTSKHVPSYNFGADGRINQWLRWYFDYSANYNFANTETDLYGRNVDRTTGKGGEVGFKFTPLDSKISGSFDYYVNEQNDYATNTGGPAAAQGIVNPVGINGQRDDTGTVGTFVNEDQKSHGIELNISANPVPNWRIRLSATMSNGVNNSNVVYPILYNDQFHTDGKGGVTYADGSPFLVPVTPGTSVTGLTTPVNPNTSILVGVPTQQLTTAMIGSPSSPYYAWQGGAVTAGGNLLATSNVARVLKNFNTGGGLAGTGAVGLPISQIQYAWPDPNGTGGSLLIAQPGQATVGYPVYGISLVNTYQFTRGPLKGFGAVLGLNDQWKWRTYYYNAPGATGIVNQQLWSQSALGLQINLNPFYEHRFGRFLWRTQLDITNLTNHYVLQVLANNGSGYTNFNNLAIRWDNQPRSYAWSNKFSF